MGAHPQVGFHKKNRRCSNVVRPDVPCIKRLHNIHVEITTFLDLWEIRKNSEVFASRSDGIVVLIPAFFESISSPRQHAEAAAAFKRKFDTQFAGGEVL